MNRVQTSLPSFNHEINNASDRSNRYRDQKYHDYFQMEQIKKKWKWYR